MLPQSNLSLAVAIFDSISETERLRLEWLNVRILLLRINQALTVFTHRAAFAVNILRDIQ